jgi:hypothetical protein
MERIRAERMGEPEREQSRAPRAPQPHHRILSLQRAAGNRAVSALLQRYEAGEHAQVGGPGTVTVNGVEMTEGEVNAMGDFYNSPGEMTSAPPAELTRLRDLIRRDRDARTGKPGATPVSTAEWQQATNDRYLKLAAQNRAHFAPPADGTGLTGENHKARWYEIHRQALFQAWFDGRFINHAVSNSARTINAFGAHFLTDAFSAGHLVNKPAITQFARDRWNSAPTTGLIFKENAFTKAVAAAVLADPKAGAELRGMELKLIEWGDVTVTRFSEFLWQFAKKDPDKFFNAFARMIHDHLDDAIKAPTGGVEVTNERGDKPWRLSGDATLGLSPETLRIAGEAALMADQNLLTAAAATGEPDYTSLSNAVWALTPKPTKDGAKVIDDAVTHIGDAANADSVAAFAALAIAEIDSGVKELEDAGYMRVKEPKLEYVPVGID